MLRDEERRIEEVLDVAGVARPISAAEEEHLALGDPGERLFEPFSAAPIDDRGAQDGDGEPLFGEGSRGELGLDLGP